MTKRQLLECIEAYRSERGEYPPAIYLTDEDDRSIVDAEFKELLKRGELATYFPLPNENIRSVLGIPVFYTKYHRSKWLPPEDSARSPREEKDKEKHDA